MSFPNNQKTTESEKTLPWGIRMLSFVYDVSLWFYFSGIRIASFFLPKARLWVEGQRQLFASPNQTFDSFDKKGRKLIWMHCASAGEFEMGRPLMELLKREKPHYHFLLSFFSSSGYQLRKSFKGADWVCYLPVDSKNNAKRFLELLCPDLAIFVQYEFWFHYLDQIKKKGIPAILLSAHFRPDQPFFKFYGSLHRYMLTCFSRILVKDAQSADLLFSIGLMNYRIAGNTRIDRVFDIARTRAAIPGMEEFCGNKKVLIGGSTWPEDEKIILSLLQNPEFQDWIIILAPHEVNPNRIRKLLKNTEEPVVRFSELNTSHPNYPCRILLIDNVGLLSSLYQYAHIAYVGGGFGKSIHSIIEPAAFGLPVIIGPKHQKFPEAAALILAGGAFEIHNRGEFLRIMSRLNESESRLLVSSMVQKFMIKGQGATQIAAAEVERLLAR